MKAAAPLAPKDDGGRDRRKAWKSIVLIDDGSVYRCDTLLLDDSRWIVVPDVDEARSDGATASVRMLFLNKLNYRAAKPEYGADFVLDDVVPKAVWSGEQKDTRFKFESRPRQLIWTKARLLRARFSRKYATA